MKRFVRRTAVLASSLALFPAAAHAGPPSPAVPPSQNTCALTDVWTIEGVYAVACAGKFSGNDAPEWMLPVIGQYLNDNYGDYGPFTHLGQSDYANKGPFSNKPTGKTGQILFDDPMSGYFGIIFKGGPAYAIYIMDGGAGTGGVNFNLKTVLDAGNSHTGLWDGGNPPPPSVVPEPSTYLLMTAGLLGLGAVARRRRKA